MGAIGGGCAVCASVGEFCEVVGKFLCRDCDKELHDAYGFVGCCEHHGEQHGAAPAFGESAVNRTDAVGAGWGRLAIMGDRAPPMAATGNESPLDQRGNGVCDEEWPQLSKGLRQADSLGSTKRDSSFPRNGTVRVRNANNPVSSWEGIQSQRQHQRWASEIRKQLFVSESQQIEREWGELEEACKGLEEGMRRMANLSSKVGAELNTSMAAGEPLGPEVGDDPADGLDRGGRFFHGGMFNHSWKPIGPEWIWISKATAVDGFGYPASGSDILKFGSGARRVRRIGPPPPLSRSFAEAVREGMAGKEQGNRSWKRRTDEWQDDDLLGEDFQREQDLRQKLQRGMIGDRQDWHQQGGNRFTKPVPGGSGYGAVGRFGGKGDAGGSHMSGFHRSQPAGKDIDRNYKGQGDERGKNMQLARGGFEQRVQGTAGTWRPKEPTRPKKHHEEESLDIKCFRCLKTGHHQSECVEEPICYKCKQEGHMAAECNQIKGKLQLFGFGIPNKGFYSIEIPETKVQRIQTSAVVVILSGEANEVILNDVLRLAINDEWDYQPRKMMENEYLVTFPDKETLSTYTRLAGLDLSSNLKVKIIKSTVDPTTFAVLQTCWVRISNIPTYAREKWVAKELATLVGQPIAVDDLSLIRDGPIRVQVNCRDPSIIRCVIEIFFNKVGYEVKFVAEDKAGRIINPKGGPPGGGNNDKPDKKNQDEAEGSKGKKRLGKFERFDNLDREQDNTQEGSQEEMEREELEDHQMVLPLAAFHPDLGNLVLNGEKDLVWGPTTNILRSQEKSEVKAAAQDDIENIDKEEETVKGMIKVSGTEGSYYMDKDKWPKLTLFPKDQESSEHSIRPGEATGGNDIDQGGMGTEKGESVDRNLDYNLKDDLEEMGVLTQEDLMDQVDREMDSQINIGSSSENDSQGSWVRSKKKSSKKKRTARVTVALRASSRIQNGGRTILEKATQRTMEKNNISGDVGGQYEREGQIQDEGVGVLLN